MTTANPFIRGYQDLYVRRELLVTYDDHFEPCYRQITAEQQDLADDQLIGHHSIFNETHALAVEPGDVTEDQHALYSANGQIRAVVYAVRGYGERPGASPRRHGNAGLGQCSDGKLFCGFQN